MTIFVKALKIVLTKKCINCCYFLVLIHHIQAPRQLRYSRNMLKVKLDNAVQMVATLFLPIGHKQWVQENSQNGRTFHLTSGHSRNKIQITTATPLANEIRKNNSLKVLS